VARNSKPAKQHNTPARVEADTRHQVLMEDALHAVAVAVSAALGDDIFREVVRHVGQALQADLAMVSRLVPGPAGASPQEMEMETLSIHALDGSFPANMRYPLRSSPCAAVFGQNFHQVSGDLRQRFPHDPMLDSMQLDFYAGYPLFSSNGDALGLIAVLSNKPLPERLVTESLLSIFAVRTAAELERLQAEISYREIFNASDDAIFIHDIDTGAILDANPKACATYGYTHAELLQLDVGQLSAGYPPYTMEYAARLIALAREGNPQRFEWQRRNRDGSLHWDEVMLRRATIGGVDRILGMTRDISERKAALDALSSSEQQFRAMVSTALDCIISMDAEGRVTGFNPAAERCFGYTQQQVLGQALADLIVPPRLREAHLRGMQHYLDRGRGHFLGRRVEVMAQRANGEEFPAELAITSVAHADGMQFIGYLRDITERRQAETERAQLEKQLRQAQRMEAIGQLTGGIAHDFNNLLTSILGYTGMSLGRAQELKDHKLLHQLQQTRRGAERARELIQQLLTFSRGGRGQPQATSVGRVVEEFMPLLKATFPAGINLQVELADKLPAVMLDPVQLEQVLMNLCVNARDAMGDMGELRITCTMEHVNKAACASCLQTFTGTQLVLAVQDSGPGIAQEVRARMFEPFYSSKAQGKGSGMGLAIVHGIVHEWGGHIELESETGGGSTFSIHIPCPATQLQPMVPNSAGQLKSAAKKLSGRVALVDDEPLVADFMIELLQDWGLQASAFTNPQEASLALGASLEDWDVVILDQVMPGLSGLELAQQLLQKQPTLPVLLYTGYSDRLDEPSVLQHGVKALLRKPLDEAKLHHLLSTLLQQN
jgi:PAS domain S-box-containing protein